jgi:hypothetical protein
MKEIRRPRRHTAMTCQHPGLYTVADRSIWECGCRRRWRARRFPNQGFDGWRETIPSALFSRIRWWWTEGRGR